MGNTFFFEWENSLIEWLQANLSGGVISVISTLSFFGEVLLCILLLGFLYWSWDKELGKKVGLSVLAANVANPMIKNVIVRRRPYFDNEQIEILRVIEPEADIYDIKAQGYSFPSGHSTCASALFGSIAVYTRKKVFWILACLIPLLVGLSRVTVGAHYPTDVFAGWLVSVAVIALIALMRRYIKNEHIIYGLLVLLALPGLFYCESTDYYTGFGLLVGFAAAMPFEERFVKFENTRSPIRAVLRVIGGLAVFFLMDKLLKLPFSAEFLAQTNKPVLLIRCARYAILAFTEFALYPILFKYTARIGKKA